MKRWMFLGGHFAGNHWSFYSESRWSFSPFIQASSQKMIYPLMQRMFQATEEEEVQMELKLLESIEEETGDAKVAMSVMAYLPIYLENRAITNYIRQTRNQHLRAMMPEIFTAEEAGSMAQRDNLLDQDQVNLTAKVIRAYQVRLKNEQPNRRVQKRSESKPGKTGWNENMRDTQLSLDFSNTQEKNKPYV